MGNLGSSHRDCCRPSRGAFGPGSRPGCAGRGHSTDCLSGCYRCRADTARRRHPDCRLVWPRPSARRPQPQRIARGRWRVEGREDLFARGLALLDAELMPDSTLMTEGRIGFTYAVDVLDEGAEAVVANLRGRAALTGVAVAASYHAARDLLPHNPRRVVAYQESGAVYF